MADPICRWRNTTSDTVKELVRILPKSSMKESEFKVVVKKNCEKYGFSYDGFFSTAYQLAVQIGLYFIDDSGVFHPRFDHNLGDDEAQEYVSRVAGLYVSPNPYARSMQTSSAPIALYDYFVQCADKLPKNSSIDVKDALSDYYKVPIGNVDMVVNLLARTGSFEKVDGRHIKYVGYVGVAEDKEKYFRHFGIVLHDEKDFNQLSEVDYLFVALKLFQLQRAGDVCNGEQLLPGSMRQEFIDWCVKVDGKKEITPKTYLPPLESVSMPMEVEAMKSSWNGVYEFVYGKKPAKHVLEIATAAELDEIYGELLKVYAAKDSPMPEGVSAAKWNKVRAWVKADRAKGRSGVILHESAFKKYRQFLEWREANGVANGGPNGWASYDAWAKAARETFAKVDAGMLAAVDFDYVGFARKFVYNPTVANVYFKDHDANAKAEVGNFISQNRRSPKAASWYLEKDNLPNAKGFGVGCALNFMMKVRPVEFATYSPMIDSALMFVGLLAKSLPADSTVVSYEQNKSLQGQVLAKMHELHIGKAADDDSAADYLTVNEFAWWLSDEKNKDLIKKEVLKMSVKPVKHDKRPDGDRKELKLNLEEKDDRLMLRLMAALRTKPFAILAGHSGTGKSRMVRRLAYMTCRDGSLRDEQTGKVGNFCMIQVKPNWHDSTDLLGYYSSMGGSYQPTEFVKFIEKAYAYPHVPFFVCLDEMNLAPVEQYFAEYLSAIESMRKSASGEFVSDPIVAKDVYRDIKGLEPEFTESVAWLEKYGLTIPRNLFVVGTVNMDETTNEFSRKVLDRAMTIEMTDVAFENFKKTSPEPTFADCLKDEPIDNLMDGEVQAADLSECQLKNLNAIKAVLASTAFAVAYRFANEYALYADSLARFNGGDDSAAFDHMVLMKVLPRIAGDSEMVKKIFAGLKGVLSSETESHKKMEEIEERDGEDLTFWP